MKRISYVLVSLFYLFYCSKSNGQKETSIVADFKKMNEVYDQFNDVSVNVMYTLFSDYSTDKPIETKNGFYKKHNKLHLTKTDNIEMLQTPDYFIVKDSKNKKVLLSKPISKFKPKLTLVALDSMLSFCSKVKMTETKTQKMYKMHYDKLGLMGFEDVDILMGKENYLIQKMVIYYIRPMQKTEGKTEKTIRPRLEISFTDYSTKAQPSILFSEHNYIKNTNNKFEVSSLCNGYSLINQLTKN